MPPSIGQIVNYRLANSDAEAINARRKDAREKMAWHHALRTGAQVHVGNTVDEDDVYPLIVTRVWGDTPGSCFNGQLMLDGTDTFWITSTKMGDKQRECVRPTAAAA